jgi:hypothetical protein
VEIITNPLETILEPFREIEIASTYSKHYLFIDFLIYLIIFSGLSQYVLGKKFPGKGGKAISGGIAIALSAGMTVFSASTGFNLSRFGPVAAGIIMILASLIIYSLIKQIGGNTINASLIAFIITYFLMRATAPEIYQWALKNQFAAWIDAALVLSIPLLLVMLLLRAKKSLPQGLKLPNFNLTKTLSQQSEEKGELANLKEEKALAKAAKEEDKKALHTEKVVTKDLSTIINLLKGGKLTPEIIGHIRSTLSDLQQKESKLTLTLARVSLLSQKLERWEIETFQKLHQTFQNLPPPEREKFKRVIQQEQQSIVNDKSIKELGKQAEQCQQEYRKLLGLAINELGHQNVRGSIYFLLKAKERQNFSESLMKQAATLLDQLLHLTKGSIQEMRKLAA